MNRWGVKKETSIFSTSSKSATDTALEHMRARFEFAEIAKEKSAIEKTILLESSRNDEAQFDFVAKVRVFLSRASDLRAVMVK